MTISLPESMQLWIQAQASKEGKTPDEYVVDLVRAAQAREGDVDAWLRESIADLYGDDAVTPEVMEKARRGLEAQLIEGLESGPPIEVNEEFWHERRRILQERITARKKTRE
jgi:Arc/MetJ-type ribon-helix-helix transcriptional regulator